MKKIIQYTLAALFLFVLIVLSGFAAKADEIKRVVSFGNDLTEEQKNSMLDIFDVDRDEVFVLEVTNEEEREYLKGLVSEKFIGTKAISSSYVESLRDDEGIRVKTHNIDWVTKEMYANALVTAGVENARIIAAAPFSVSGTAALTGIMKAFEKATGNDLPEESKRTANEELVTTGKLGDDIGRDKAAALVNRIKERIIRGNVKEPGEIRKIIINIAADLNINLTEEHIDMLVSLMEKISRLDLNAENMTTQLENISKNLEKVTETLKENKGILQKILDLIRSFFKWLSKLLR